MSPYKGTLSGRYPRCSRALSESLKTSCPAIKARPEVAGIKLDKIRIVVLLPAPFGPRKPTISPFLDLKAQIADGSHSRSIFL